MAGTDWTEQDYIVHSGTVSKILDNEVIVKIEDDAVCSACHVKGSCGLADKEDKTISVPRSGDDYKVYDQVRILMRKDLGMKAIALAYIVPFVVLIISLLLFLTYFSEWQAALLALMLVAMYFLVLSHFNKLIGKTFNVHIERLEL